MVYLLQIPAAEVSHLHSFGVAPDSLFRIDLGCMAGEALQMDPLRRAFAQELLDKCAAVDGCSIPDGEQRARNMAEQVLQETDHLHARDRLLMDLEVELLVQPHGSDDREMIPAEHMPKPGCLAHECVDTRHRR